MALVLRAIILRRRYFRDSGAFANLLHLLTRSCSEQVHHPSDDSCPSGLVTGAEPRPVVAMEILIEREEVAPMGILLKLSGATINGSTPIAIPQEDVSQPMS